MGYDQTNNEARTKRKRPRAEIKDETGDDGILNPNTSRLTTNQIRDLYRNYSQAKSLIQQLCLNVLGSGTPVIFKTGNSD